MQWSDAHFKAWSGGDGFSNMRGQAAAKFVPESVIRPVFDSVVEVALHIISAADMGAHTAQGKAALVTHINEFLAHRRHVGENTQPAKGIVPLEDADFIAWNTLPCNSMKAITACYKITDQLFLFTVLFIDDAWRVSVIILHADGRRFIVNNTARFVNVRF